MPLSPCFEGIPKHAAAMLSAWLAGRVFRQHVGTPPPQELRLDVPEEVLQWEEARLRRAAELSHAFRAGALGNSAWGEVRTELQIEVHRRAVAWELAELERRAAAQQDLGSVGSRRAAEIERRAAELERRAAPQHE